MRRIYLFTFFFVCCVATALAQEPQYEYVPLVREGVKWYWALNNPTIRELYVSYFNGDTILDGTRYKKYYYYNIENTGVKTPVAFMREVDKVVYVVYNKFHYDIRYLNDFIIVTDSELGEQELYNFNQPNHAYVTGNPFTPTQGTVIDGITRKCWTGSESLGIYLVEGIGIVSDFSSLSMANLGVVWSAKGTVGLSHVEENGKTVFYGPNYFYFANPGNVYDLNRDGAVNVGDISIVYNYIINTGNINLGSAPPPNTDGYGVVNVGDISALYSEILQQ